MNIRWLRMCVYLKFTLPYVFTYCLARVLQRDVVYLGWQIAPCIWAQMRGEGVIAGSQPMSTAAHRSSNKLWGSNSIFNLWDKLFHQRHFTPIVSFNKHCSLFPSPGGRRILHLLVSCDSAEVAPGKATPCPMSQRKGAASESIKRVKRPMLLPR